MHLHCVADTPLTPPTPLAQIKRDKIVRKPTAFNHFVREKMAELKAQGMTIEEDKNNNELFKVWTRKAFCLQHCAPCAW